MIDQQRQSTIETLGAYRLIGALAQGGMGRVYLATKSGPEGFEKVAVVKRILPAYASQARFREMFLDEGRVAARLDHPNIVRTDELCEESGDYIICMEYLPGEDLSRAIKATQHAGKRVPIEVAIAIASGCAEALHFAHALPTQDGGTAGLVHRDVNPSNIIVTYHGAVKLLDFGIAKVRDSSHATIPGAFKGKMRYAAPEQISNGRVDARTDVFALGVALWEMLTGNRLFHASSEAQVIDAVVNRPIGAPSSMRKSIPPAIDQIVLKALARDPNARFQSAREFADALSRLDVYPHNQTVPQLLSEWLLSVFGEERAALKIRIARGQDLEQAFQELKTSSQISTRPSKNYNSGGSNPKRGWSTDLPSVTESSAREYPAALSNIPTPRIVESPFDSGETYDARSNTPLMVTALLSVCLIGAGFTLVASGMLDTNGAPAIDKATGGFSITSEPAGGQIYVNGEPTGRQTPTVLQALEAGTQIDILVKLAGYTGVTQTLAVGSNRVDDVRFDLIPTGGRLEWGPLPENAVLYVDGEMVEPGVTSVDLFVGQYEVRLESGDALLFEKTIDVRPGTIKLDLSRGAQP